MRRSEPATIAKWSSCKRPIRRTVDEKVIDRLYGGSEIVERELSVCRQMVELLAVVRSGNRTIQIHRKSKRSQKLHRQVSENQGKLSANLQSRACKSSHLHDVGLRIMKKQAVPYTKIMEELAEICRENVEQAEKTVGEKRIT